MWHYSGALLHETIWPVGQELYEVAWQRFPDGVHAAQPISSTKVAGIKSSQPIASAEPYRPPGARGIPQSPLTPSARPNQRGAGGAPGAKRPNDRSKQQQQRPTNNRKRFENGDAEHSSSVSAPELTSNNNNNTINTNADGDSTNTTPTHVNPFAKPNGRQTATPTNGGRPASNVAVAAATNAAAAAAPTLSPEEFTRLKRTRLLAKKLSDISKLKARKDKGEHLEINQLAKITSEAELLTELAELKLS